MHNNLMLIPRHFEMILRDDAAQSSVFKLLLVLLTAQHTTGVVPVMTWRRFLMLFSFKYVQILSLYHLFMRAALR